MELRRIDLNWDTVQQYFPELFDSNTAYEYFIEISVLRVPNRKTLQSIHMSAARQRTQGEFIMREILPYGVPCVRASLDKPMRQAQRDTIYFEAKKKLQERIEIGISHNMITHEHPYAQAVANM